MVQPSHCRLHDGDVIRAETHHKAQQNEQNHIFGPAVASRLVGHRVFLGRLVELAADLAVTAQDESKWHAKPNDAGNQKTICHLVATKIGELHARSTMWSDFQGALEEQYGCLKENHHPYQSTDTSHDLGFPQSLTPLTVQHGQVAIHTDAGHEGDASIGIAVEDHGSQPAQEISKRPVEASDVVCDPTWKCQGEEGVGDGQVDQIYRGGVHLLLFLTGDPEDQAVTCHVDDKNQAVENGEEDPSRLLVDENIASLVCVAVIHWHRLKFQSSLICHVPETVWGNRNKYQNLHVLHV